MAILTRRRWLALAAAGPAAGLWLGAPDRGSPARRTGRFGAGHFPDVQVIAHDGRRLRFYDDLVRGRTVMFNFMYTVCRGICPGVTTNLLAVQKLLAPRVGRDIFLCSITLKPEEDTPAALARYVEARGIGPGWTFVTGERADLELVRRRLGAVDPDPVVDADTTQHTGMIRYGNEPRERWASCAGAANPRWIARSVLWAADA
jgi:protein SCO1/2